MSVIMTVLSSANLRRPGRVERSIAGSLAEGEVLLESPGGSAPQVTLSGLREPDLEGWRQGGDWVTVEDDKARFANVVLPYLGDAYALARSLTGNRVDAEDVVQEACLRAFRAIGGVVVGNARAWVLTIVHHTACTWLVRNRQGALVMVDDLEAVEQAQVSPRENDHETPEAALIAKSERAYLEAAIAALPPLFRETLMLRDVQGLDYREIAKVTDVPIGTVMSRLARARARVMAAVGKQAP